MVLLKLHKLLQQLLTFSYNFNFSSTMYNSFFAECNLMWVYKEKLKTLMCQLLYYFLRDDTILSWQHFQHQFSQVEFLVLQFLLPFVSVYICTYMKVVSNSIATFCCSLCSFNFLYSVSLPVFVTYIIMYIHKTVEPLNNGHFGTN